MTFVLSRRGRTVLKVVHIATSVALLGELWALTLLNLVATLTDDLGLARSAYRLMTPMIFGGGVPLSLTALATGITLALGTHWGLTRHGWVLAKLVLLISTILVGMLLFDPAGMATALQGPVRPTGSQWTQVAFLSTQVVMVITATVLSVVKPRRRAVAKESRTVLAVR
jgi:uncharacterized membrane protein